jgi:hypothetical protein
MRKTMKSAIEDLWRGELCPGEEPLQNTKEIQDLIISIKQHEEELKKLLDDKQNAILRELLADLEFLYILKRFDNFKKGFSLASKLLSEAFSE